MKAASLLVMSLMLKVESLQGSVTTCSWSTTSTSGSCMARRLMAEKSKPYTLSQKSIFSCLQRACAQCCVWLGRQPHLAATGRQAMHSIDAAAFLSCSLNKSLSIRHIQCMHH